MKTLSLEQNPLNVTGISGHLEKQDITHLKRAQILENVPSPVLATGIGHIAQPQLLHHPPFRCPSLCLCSKHLHIKKTWLNALLCTLFFVFDAKKASLTLVCKLYLPPSAVYMTYTDLTKIRHLFFGGRVKCKYRRITQLLLAEV